MIGTLQALLVAVLAVLPGALFTIARERTGASWAWRQTDAATLIFRFLSASAVFHAVFAPVTYHAYQELIVTHALVEGRTISWSWWAWLLAYLVLPYLLGVITEKARPWSDDPSWLKRVISWVVALYSGRYPQLRAWDWFFSKKPAGVMRLQLMNGEWKAGLFNKKSFASSYGEEGDIYLAEQYIVRADGVPVLEDGRYKRGKAGLLIRWSEVRYFDFAPWGEADKAHENSRENTDG
jgi:glucan phosphoethanolaminetransferase (alkaline phosphatase superfamily)